MLLLVAWSRPRSGVVAHQRAPLDRCLRAADQRTSGARAAVYYVFIFLVVAGAANAVNLTDGLDGLAAGTITIAALTYAAIMLVAFLAKPGRALQGCGRQDDPRRLDLAIICRRAGRRRVGFLWYNAYPADVFMGDTGSFGLGGALAAIAVFTKTELLLVVIGGVFVIEALSVAIQVVAFKTTGKRVFLMAPIHHHFEMMEWTENKIIVRFWIIGGDLRGERLRPLLPLLLEVP